MKAWTTIQTIKIGFVSSFRPRTQKIYQTISLLLSWDSELKKIVWISLVNHTIKLMMLKSRIILTEVLLRNYPHLTSKNNMVRYITFLITNFKNLNHNLLQSELYLILLHHMFIKSWMTTGLKDWILTIIYLAHKYGFVKTMWLWQTTYRRCITSQIVTTWSKYSSISLEKTKQPDHWQLSAVTFGNNPSGAITLAQVSNSTSETTRIFWSCICHYENHLRRRHP